MFSFTKAQGHTGWAKGVKWGGGGMGRQRYAKRKKVKGGIECCSKAPPSGLVFGLINFAWPCRAVASCREAFEKVASLAKKCNTPCTLNVSISLSLSFRMGVVSRRVALINYKTKVNKITEFIIGIYQFQLSFSPCPTFT